MNNTMFKKMALGLIIVVVLVLNVLRFWKLDTIPYGFHVDEVGSAVTMQCLAQSGCDAELRRWPLFGFMEYGQDKPPIYIYPGILWVKVFGSTVPSLRAYSVFALLAGILGLFFLSKELYGGAFAAAGCFGGHLFALGVGCDQGCVRILFCCCLYHLGPLFFVAFQALVGLGAGGRSVCLRHVCVSAGKIANTFNDGDAGDL